MTRERPRDLPRAHTRIPNSTIADNTKPIRSALPFRLARVVDIVTFVNPTTNSIVSQQGIGARDNRSRSLPSTVHGCFILCVEYPAVGGLSHHGDNEDDEECRGAHEHLPRDGTASVNTRACSQLQETRLPAKRQSNRLCRTLFQYATSCADPSMA